VVDPVSEDDRRRTLWRAKIASVALVGGSAGLITLQGDAGLAAVAVAVVVGLCLGAALVWYLFPDLETLAPASGDRYRR
jgi:cell division protein FtsW (lipid II flippase)